MRPDVESGATTKMMKTWEKIFQIMQKSVDGGGNGDKGTSELMVNMKPLLE